MAKKCLKCGKINVDLVQSCCKCNSKDFKKIVLSSDIKKQYICSNCGTIRKNRIVMILKKKNLVVAIIYLILLICASIYANKRLGNPFSGAGDFSGCLFIFAFILAIIFIPFIFLIPALPIILLLKVMFTEKCLKCKSGK